MQLRKLVDAGFEDAAAPIIPAGLDRSIEGNDRFHLKMA
jgi:hypothetical protein